MDLVHNKRDFYINAVGGENKLFKITGNQIKQPQLDSDKQTCGHIN